MPTTLSLVLSGATAGLSIAMPIGPLGLLCVERSLRSGFGAGFSTGLGGVTVNVGAAALLLTAAQTVLPLLDGGSRTLGTLGGLFLLWSAVRVLTRTASAPSYRAGPSVGWRPAYLSGLAYNACNPLSLVLVMAALSPVIGSGLAATPGQAAALLAGMVVAASAWWACLSFAASGLRTRLSPAVLASANRLAGALLGAYAAMALLRAWTA